MRTEGLEYLRDTNRWIEFAAYQDGQNLPSTGPLHHLPATALPSHVLPIDFVHQVKNNTTMTIRMGNGCGAKVAPAASPSMSVIFACNVEVWLDFCCQLPGAAEMCKNVSFDLALKYHNNYAAFISKFLIYLGAIRTIKKAHFTQLMHVPFFERLCDNMVRELERPEDLHEFAQGIKEEGDLWQSQGKFRAAASTYLLASNMHSIIIHKMTLIARQISIIQRWMDTNPVMNGLSFCHKDIQIGIATSLLKRIDLYSDGGAYVSGSYGLLFDCNDHIQKLWQNPCMTAEQRMHVHMITGKLHMQFAKYLSYSDDNVAHFASNNASMPTHQVGHRRLAAQEFFYAADLDKHGVTDAQACYLELKADPELHIDNIPVSTQRLGSTAGCGWRGDPRIWQRCGSLGQEYLQKCLRMENSHAMVYQNAAELEQLKQELGIEWWNVSEGVLRFLV